MRKFSLRGSFSSLQPMATPPSPRNPNEHLRRTKSLLPNDGRKPQTRLPQTIPHDERPSKSQLGGPEQSALHPRYRSLLLLIVCLFVCLTLEFDAAGTAPLFGHASFQDYYNTASSTLALPKIKTPLFILHALDDPIVCMTSP